MSRVVLDTNAYVRFLGELFAGFAGGPREMHNRVILESFLKKPSVQILDATRETAEVFGKLRDAMKKAGTPLPTDDLWLAAQVFESGSVIVTFDSHFKKIPNLRTLSW